MSHVSGNRALLTRVRRLKGQVEALEKALQNEGECRAVLTQAAAIRGAAQSLMIGLLQDHLQEHVALEGDQRVREVESAAVAGMLRSYFK